MNIDVRSLPPKYQQQVLAKAIAQQGRKREPKYRNLKTERMVDGRRIAFDSRKEAQRYDQLKAMLKRGEIENLRLQQDFTLFEAYTSASGFTGAVGGLRTGPTARYILSNRRTGEFYCGIFWRRELRGGKRRIR